jgi:hydrogenase maturation protease
LVSKPHTLIAGIGNIFLRDDAFGCEVVKELNKRVWPADVRIVDFGIRGFDLAYALLEEYDVVILVDATPRGEAPGTVYTIEPDVSDIEIIDSRAAVVETHGMNPLKVLGMVKSMGGTFQKLLLVGCEPETFGPEEGQMGLSSVVQAAVPQAVSIVERLVERYQKPEIEFVERQTITEGRSDCTPAIETP